MEIICNVRGDTVLYHPALARTGKQGVPENGENAWNDHPSHDQTKRCRVF